MFKKILGRFNFGNTLYYPGCLTHHALPKIEKNYEKVLRALGIDFIFLPGFSCCGSPVTHAGYEKDFEKLKEKNNNFFKKYGVSRIITNCPACYKVLSGYGLEVEHITQTVWKGIGKIKMKHKGEITYHDPCHLGRHSNIYDEPRNILKAIGFDVVELQGNRGDSMCCGAGGGLKTNYPKLSGNIADNLLKRVRTKKLVTPCPMCYAHFKENAPKGLEILEFSEVLV
jgi:Fe-S oxidoreductase